eukprot:CAMPEP_0172170596 /NCGR_PEP_ID=MMETSP1050-20130122/11365_1 /TAXON_ID=233186 /ORGANISM="Cryptomonas curvata, Strain CCAP979/52" /LENGTH=154 /DNA_ID=CAMNT_0012841815 /DNA_START=185 /DNA_END=645 /DNA_ORIENTATION=+
MFGLYTHCQPLREPGVPVAIRSKRLCGTAPPVKGESEATAEPGKPGEGWALPPLLQWQRLRYQAPRRFISQSQASLLFAASKWLICIKIPPAPTRKTEAASHRGMAKWLLCVKIPAPPSNQTVHMSAFDSSPHSAAPPPPRRRFRRRCAAAGGG